MEPLIVPPPEIYTAPACKVCAAPYTPGEIYAGPWGQNAAWQQACACPPYEAGGSVRLRGEKALYAIQYADPDRIGQPIPRQCVLCQQPVAPGSAAHQGQFGPHRNYGYAHPACVEADATAQADAATARHQAQQGAALSVWFSVDLPTVAAPATGHYDAARRDLPADLPALPPGTVAYADYRRPFAMTRLDIPDMAAAEAWWTAATSVADAAYELHWFADRNDPATRRWTGEGFGEVTWRARQAEIAAGTI